MSKEFFPVCSVSSSCYRINHYYINLVNNTKKQSDLPDIFIWTLKKKEMRGNRYGRNKRARVRSITQTHQSRANRAITIQSSFGTRILILIYPRNIQLAEEDAICNLVPGSWDKLRRCEHYFLEWFRTYHTIYLDCTVYTAHDRVVRPPTRWKIILISTAHIPSCYI